MDKNLLIIGAGGHGRVVAEVAAACGYENISFLDDNSPEAIGKINVNFDGEILIITYDNGSIFKQMNLSLVNQKDFSDYERYFYIDPKMPSDTIIYESGYMIGYVKIILPAKRESDDYYGYTSYTDYNIKYKKDPNYLTQN